MIEYTHHDREVAQVTRQELTESSSAFSEFSICEMIVIEVERVPRRIAQESPKSASSRKAITAIADMRGGESWMQDVSYMNQCVDAMFGNPISYQIPISYLPPGPTR